jgi:8-oxo-dGTP pyrophosphatase MutT (NUDIX family)
MLCLPGGGVRRGEEPREAALREIREELGLTIDGSNLEVCLEYEGLSDFRRARLVVFELFLKREPTLVPDNREIMEAKFWNVHSLFAMDIDPVMGRYLSSKLPVSISSSGNVSQQGARQEKHLVTESRARSG